MEEKIVDHTQQTIVKQNSNEIIFQNSIIKGEEILKENDFFKDLISLMHNMEFNNFYKNYFQNWSDIETMIFYMKLYKAIEYGYSIQYDSDINQEFMTFILHKVITTSELRKKAISIFKNFKESSLSDKEIFCKLLDYNTLQNEKLLLK